MIPEKPDIHPKQGAIGRLVHLGTNPTALRRLINLGMLIGGFGLGQGSVFLAQTFLVAKGKTELLALFGTHFSFAMLGIIAVEAGSLTILSAQIARIVQSGEPPEKLWRSYWETTVFRVTMALLLLLLAAAAFALIDLPDFSRAYLLAALPAFLLWAFNAAGMLDGLQKSGISGLSGSIAYVASAIALVMSWNDAPEDAGFATGLALSIGYGLTILVQFMALVVVGWRPRWAKPSPSGIKQAFIEEGSMLAGLLPGQLYFRAQLAIAGLFLGTTATAILVYSKQIVGAGSQVSGFARRIEFPNLVRALDGGAAASARTVLAIQKISFAIASLMAGTVLAAGIVLMFTASGFTQDVWTFLSIFCLTMLTESVGQALVQGLFARGRYHAAAVLRIAAVVLAIGVCWLLVGPLGVFVFVIADFVSHATVISLSLRALQRDGRGDNGE